MSSVIEKSPAIEQAKQTTVAHKDRLLKTLSFVPDDKLTWSPAPTSKSALTIAAHCAISNRFFIGIINRTPMPTDVPFEVMRAEAQKAEAAVTTREAAIKLIEDSTAAVLAAIDEVNPAELGEMVETPVMTMPLAFFVYLPARHMDNHASQIDYLQTTWGDMDWHI